MQLTTVGHVSFDQFCSQFEKIAKKGDQITHVIEDPQKKKIIATATLLLEDKFIHGCGKIGHIEDVVVDSTYRGHRLGFRVVDSLNKSAKSHGCYKVILDCAEKNVAFYRKLGYKQKEVQCALYFDR